MKRTSLANSLVSPWGSNNAMVTAQKKSFPLKSSVNVTKSTVSCNWVTFTERNLNGKLHFLCAVS